MSQLYLSVLFGIGLFACKSNGREAAEIRKQRRLDSVFTDYSKSIVLSLSDAEDKAFVVNRVIPRLDTILITRDIFITVWEGKDFNSNSKDLLPGTRLVVLEVLGDTVRVKVFFNKDTLYGYTPHYALFPLTNPYADMQKGGFYDLLYKNIEKSKAEISGKYQISIDSLNDIVYSYRRGHY